VNGQAGYLMGSSESDGLRANKKMRRSFSMNDINDMLILADEDEDKKELLTNESIDISVSFLVQQSVIKYLSLKYLKKLDAVKLQQSINSDL